MRLIVVQSLLLRVVSSSCVAVLRCGIAFQARLTRLCSSLHLQCQDAHASLLCRCCPLLVRMQAQGGVSIRPAGSRALTVS